MGYSVVTTTLAKAASYDLTDLATAKVELQIAEADTSDDAWLGQAITQVSRSIARYTKRHFAPEALQDVFDLEQDAYPAQTPGGFPQLVLSRWPVLQVSSVLQTLAPGTTQSLLAGQDFRLDPETGRLLRLSPWTGVGTTWEAVPVTVQYVAGYGELVQETGAVPPAAPYQVTVGRAAGFSCDAGVTYAGGAPLGRVAANPAAGQYSVQAGVYSFSAADAGAGIALAYAVADIPPDLVEACLELVTTRYDAKDRDSALIQQDTPGIGTQRWWIGGTPGQKGPFPPDIAAALDEYRMPTVA